jgi:hypothetical protein
MEKEKFIAGLLIALTICSVVITSTSTVVTLSSTDLGKNISFSEKNEKVFDNSTICGDPKPGTW